MLAGLYLFLFRVLEGSWTDMVRDSARMTLPVVAYLGLLLSILLPITRRGGNPRRWWLLLLLPAFGAVGGVVAHVLDPARGTLAKPVMTGVWYGVFHALYLNWSWRRDARRARAGAA